MATTVLATPTPTMPPYSASQRYDMDLENDINYRYNSMHSRAPKSVSSSSSLNSSFGEHATATHGRGGYRDAVENFSSPSRQSSTKRQRQRPTTNDDSIWAETLPEHNYARQQLAEDDLEDILAMPVATELRSRRSQASGLGKQSLQSLYSSGFPSMPGGSTSSNYVSQSDRSATHSVGNAYNNEPTAVPTPRSYTDPRPRSKSQSRLPRPVDYVSPPVPPPPIDLGRKASPKISDDEMEGWETLQVAEPRNGGHVSSSKTSTRSDESRGHDELFPLNPGRQGSPANPQSTPSNILHTPSPSSRARINSKAQNRSPSASSPPTADVSRNVNKSTAHNPALRARVQSNVNRVVKPNTYLDKEDSYQDSSTPWIAAPPPAVFRSGQDGSLKGQGRPDEMVLPVVARRLEAERLAAASKAGHGLLITEWDANGRPLRGDEISPTPTRSTVSNPNPDVAANIPMQPIIRATSRASTISLAGPVHVQASTGGETIPSPSIPTTANQPSSDHEVQLPPETPRPRPSEEVLEKTVESKACLCGCIIS